MKPISFYKNPLKFQAFWKLLEKIRINKCLEYCRGRILDIGCGNNTLVKKYGNGIGVDVFPWEGVDIVCDTTKLPFRAHEFDRVFFIACLNHIPEREKVLKEAFRVLKPGGMVILTALGLKTSFLVHKIGLIFGEPDQQQRGMKEGELYGMSQKDVDSLLEKAGFEEISHKKFELGLNTVFLAKKP